MISPWIPRSWERTAAWTSSERSCPHFSHDKGGSLYAFFQTHSTNGHLCAAGAAGPDRKAGYHLLCRGAARAGVLPGGGPADGVGPRLPSVRPHGASVQSLRRAAVSAGEAGPATPEPRHRLYGGELSHHQRLPTGAGPGGQGLPGARGPGAVRKPHLYGGAERVPLLRVYGHACRDRQRGHHPPEPGGKAGAKP